MDAMGVNVRGGNVFKRLASLDGSPQNAISPECIAPFVTDKVRMSS